MTNRFILLFSSMLIASISEAQLLPDENMVTNTFRNTININNPTTTFLKPYGFEFQLRHRFGVMKPDKSIITDFLGTDLTANIQFGFAFPLGRKTTFGFNRTKTGKTYDLHAKRLIMNQTLDNRVPFTIAIYTNVAANTGEFRKILPNTYYEDGVTPFENKFNHRLIYNSQVLISRKFGENISIQLAPAFIYRNLVAAGEENYSFAIPVSGVIKIASFSSLLFEYAPLVNYEAAGNLYPLSIGFEFGTTGHVFQIIATTSAHLNESSLYTSDQCEYDKGEFLIGFNLKRNFWHKKKLKKMSQQGNI